MVQARSKHNGSRARKPKPREAIPEYSQELLEQTLKDYVQENGVRRALDFGVYAGLAFGQAARATGLLFLTLDI
jgi:hypothetical protein